MDIAKIMPNNVIYKYPVDVMFESEIMLPAGSEILSIQSQQNMPMLWAKVNPKARLEKRTILMIATGQDIPHEIQKYANFIETAKFENGEVYHFYELIKLYMGQHV